MLALKWDPKFSVEGCCPVRDNKEENLWRHQTPHDAQLLVGAGPMTSACADRTSAYPASCTSMPCSLRSAGKEGAVRSVLCPSPPRRPGCCVSFTEPDGVARDAGRLPHAASTVPNASNAVKQDTCTSRARSRSKSRLSPPFPSPRSARRAKSLLWAKRTTIVPRSSFEESNRQEFGRRAGG